MAVARTIAVDPKVLVKREDEARWRFLVRVLETCGAMTTGQLGHLYGLGENIRGIRREAQANLRREGRDILSETTIDEQGNRLPWATYRLVNLELQPHLRRTEAELAAKRVALGGRQTPPGLRPPSRPQPIPPALPGLGPGPPPRRVQGVLL